MSSKSFYLLYLFSFYTLFTSAQGISGKIISKTTKQAIPFATVTTSTMRGVYSDSLGFFRLSGSYAENDTLQFRILGYQSLKLSVGESRKMKVFELTENATALSEVVVGKRQNREVLIGCKARSKHSKITLVGSEFAIFVFNDEQKEGFLKEIAIYLDSDQEIKANFRLVIYPTLDSTREFARDEIIISDGSKKEGWFTVNLEKYRLQVLNQGFYVSLTMLANEEGIPKINIGLTEGFEGGVIHFRKRDEFSGWTDWTRFKRINDKKTTHYAMIRARMDFYD